MKIVVISNAPFIQKDGRYHAYSPYVKELAVWEKHSGEMAFFCPIWKHDNGLLIAPIPFAIPKLFVAKDFDVRNFSNFIKALHYSFWNFRQLFQAMVWADHIHLRCPGNVGLMGCIVQIFFPSKPKTAKYAGNWDPKSNQPWSYKLQRWILSNTFLTKNMQVLVYGTWTGSSPNIKPFFTASYTEADKISVAPRALEGTISMIYVGTLSAGKRPLYAIKLVQELLKKNFNIELSMYGNGSEKEQLQRFIHDNKLESVVFLKGNHPQEAMKKVYQEAHFLILPSESEGWPKVVAEAMFWGCLPIVTKVSCVPNMLDSGSRGILLTMDFDADAKAIVDLMQQPAVYVDKVNNSIQWSRKYTLDLFENEIKALLQQ